MSNREISRLFSLYAELLSLHQKDERLAALLSGAAYRLRNIEDDITGMNQKEIAELFRPEIISIVDEIKQAQTIEALDELIQLTPQGLFEMMRIKGLGGKKLSALWKTAKIDSMETLLEACRNDEVSKITGFGIKTQENIIKAIETYRSSEDYFHYASVANNVIIEINANPYRLDMDWSHIPYALQKGVMISINPDAHSIAEIDNIRWGVSAARKGGLTKDMTWNAMGLTGIENWLKKRNTKRLKSTRNIQIS